MKRLLWIICVILILLVAANYQNSTNVRLIVSHLAYNNHLSIGNLHYQISLFNVLPAGEARFMLPEEGVFQGKKNTHLSASADTSSLISRFFSAKVYLDSFLDSASELPYSFIQKIQISGKEEIVKEVSYDQKKLIMNISGIERTILPDTYEPLSIMYQLTKIDFSQNKNIEININTNQKNYVLTAKVEPRDIVIDNKTYKGYLFKGDIKRRDKNPYHKSYLTIMFIKKDVNIPVLVKVFASGLIINAKLSEVK